MKIQCKIHKKYRGIKPPKAHCSACERMYVQIQSLNCIMEVNHILFEYTNKLKCDLKDYHLHVDKDYHTNLLIKKDGVLYRNGCAINSLEHYKD